MDTSWHICKAFSLFSQFCKSHTCYSSTWWKHPGLTASSEDFNTFRRMERAGRGADAHNETRYTWSLISHGQDLTWSISAGTRLLFYNFSFPAILLPELFDCKLSGWMLCLEQHNLCGLLKPVEPSVCHCSNLTGLYPIHGGVHSGNCLCLHPYFSPSFSCFL